MGEYAEMMLDGTMCQGCGEFLCDGDDGPGFPGFCEACAADQEPEPSRSGKPFRCDQCTRRFSTPEAMQMHQQAKHAVQSATY